MLGAFVHIFLDSLQKEKASCVEIRWAPRKDSQEQPLELLLSFLVGGGALSCRPAPEKS